MDVIGSIFWKYKTSSYLVIKDYELFTYNKINGILHRKSHLYNHWLNDSIKGLIKILDFKNGLR